MVKENAVLQLGVKGQELVMATFKKLAAQKDKFIKPSKASLGAMAGTSGAAKAEQAAIEEKTKNESRLGNVAKTTASALMDVTRAASSLDPASTLNSVLAGAGKVGGAIPFLGPLAEGASALAQAGVSAASNALNAVKSAIPLAIDTAEKKERISHFGGQGVAKAAGNYSLSEKAALIDGAVGKFGKIGSNFSNSMKKLIETKVDPHQAAAIAQGNFQATGTDKGFFYQKIADSFGGLPPSIAQEMQSQLMDAFGTDDLMKDAAPDTRRAAATFDTNARSTADKLAAMSESVVGLDNTFNKLSVSMTDAASTLTDSVATFGEEVNKAVRGLPQLIADMKKVPEESMKSFERLNPGAAWLYKKWKGKD